VIRRAIPSILATLVATASGVALVACAAAPKQRGAAPAAAPDASAGMAAEAPEPYSPQVSEIVMIDSETRRFRRELGLPAKPDDQNVMQFRRLPLSRALDYCPDNHEPPTDHCRDVCDLADHICENAEDICRIAGDLQGNSWAAGKCDEAKASCKEAKEACCGCSGDGTADAGGAGAGGDASSRWWN
jgi:hypothetical protein